LARNVLAAQGVKDDTEVSLLFVDEPTIAELRQRFLGQVGPTDVLAFPIDDDPEPGGRSPDEGGTGPGAGGPEESDMPVLLGDVVVCPAVAARNADDHGGTTTSTKKPNAWSDANANCWPGSIRRWSSCSPWP
jgi:probable rRNA maturation factor